MHFASRTRVAGTPALAQFAASVRPALMAALLACLVLPAGCGFHLRGSAAAGSGGPANVSIVDLARQGSTGNWLGGGPGELARIVSETLQDGGIGIADGAPVQLELLSELIEKRVASVDATASAAEYQLDYALVWRARGSDGAALVNETRMTLDRSYRHKANAIMGSAEEEALLQRDLRRDAAMQILRRLQKLPAGAKGTASTQNQQTPAAAASGATPPAPQP